MQIFDFKTFLENQQDGYSVEFDQRWEYSQEKVGKILSLTDKYVREELILLSEKELDNILNELSHPVSMSPEHKKDI